MYRVIYASQVSEPLTERVLEAMLIDFRIHNEAEDLTGLLLYFGPDVTDTPGFLQVLEGEQESVEETYARIARDPRHHHVRLVSEGETDARLFPDWRMGLEYVTHEDLAMVVPWLASQDRPVVAMAELVSDPALAEQLLVGATY